MRLQGRTIALTGATSGIGLRLCERLAQDNRVIAVARDGTKAETLRQRLGVETVLADLSTRGGIDLLAETLANRQELDGLVHCAAVQHTPHLTAPAFRRDTIDAEMMLNFNAFVHLAAAVLPVMTARGEGFLMAVNSGLGLVPKRSSAVYCASKGALDLFCRSLRAQTRGTGVAVMQAFLPLVDTPMTEGRGSGKLNADDVAGRILEGIERGRLDHDIGKVKLLRALQRTVPGVAARIMERE